MSDLDPREKSEAAPKDGPRGVRAPSAYTPQDDQLPPELQVLYDVALRVAEERRRKREREGDQTSEE